MNQLHVYADLPRARIAPEIYGHFAEHLGRCIYEGFWVGEDSPIPNVRGIRQDVVTALRALQIPVLRWPGGCFADEYHWKDGIGPRENRKTIVNTHWGGVTENNHFGTHEFLDLCQMLDTKAYICGNVGSGSVQEMAEWVEYVSFDGSSPMADLRRQNGREHAWELPYFGVGNESWGCGGNMRPEYYADEYRRYQTYVRQFREQPSYKIACGANAQDWKWTEVLMERAGGYMDGLSLHYYTVVGTWDKKGSALDFDEAEYHQTLRAALEIEPIIARHAAIMDTFDAEKRVGMIVDEWGTWWSVEPGTNPGFLYQQNTLRDAMVAGLSLNIFHQHADRVKMANIAQTVNVLQAMILTDGAQMLLTPTYHVFEMMKANQGAMALETRLICDDYGVGEHAVPAMHASASRAGDGALTVNLCHFDPKGSASLSLQLHGFQLGEISARALSADAMNAHNSFEAPDALAPRDFADFEVSGDSVQLELPPMSLVTLQLGTTEAEAP